MGSIRKIDGKKGPTFRARVCVAGQVESSNFANRGLARAWIADRESALGRGGQSGTTKTLRDVLEEYRDNVSPGHKGARWEILRLDKLAADFGRPVDKRLRDLTADDIIAWRDARLAKVKGASVAREMGLLRAALAHAHTQRRWLSRDKLDDLRGPKKPPQAPARRRGVPPAAVTAITEALGYDEKQPVTTVSQRVAIAFLLAIETAMRAGELCTAIIDGKVARLAATKNGDAREVPLSAEARRLIERLPGGALDLEPRQIDALFRKARDTTAHRDVHFHDARSEAITRLAKKLEVMDLARTIGHRDPKSLMFYYAERADSIADRL